MSKRGFLRLLLRPEIQLHGDAGEIPLLADLVLQEAAVRLLDILRQVDEEGELRRGRRQLHGVFDTDVFAFGRGRRRLLDLSLIHI